MGANPIGELRTAEAPRRHFQDNLFLFVYRGVEFVPVQHEERFHCGMTDALIAVNERMISDRRECECRGFLMDSRMKFLT